MKLNDWKLPIISSAVPASSTDLQLNYDRSNQHRQWLLTRSILVYGQLVMVLVIW